MFLIKCQFKECPFEADYINSTLDDGEKKTTLCPNHQLAWAILDEAKHDITYHPSEVQPGNCLLCSEKGVHYHDPEFEVELCEKHLKKLIKRNLDKKDFKVLYDKFGGVFLLHDDFYDEEGHAIQPAD